MPATDRLDLFKSLKTEYAQPRTPRLIDTTPGIYLTATGQSAPGSDDYGARVADLYAVAYTLKFRRKLGDGPDFVVGKLECRWLALPEHRDATTGWQWQLLIRVPDFITSAELDETVSVLIDKRKPATVREVQLVPLHEATCVQMLHIGPYDQEPETFARMQAFAAEQDLAVHDAPHDIYLSDPRRVEPARLKTILRQPVRQNA